MADRAPRCLIGTAAAVGTKQRTEQVSGDTPTAGVAAVKKPNSERTFGEATAGAVDKPNSECTSEEAPAVTWASGGTIRPLVVLLTATQSRPANIPILLLASLQLRSLKLLDPSPTATTFTTLLLAHASYFGLGGTNSISSIDLSNAYNGVSSYNVAAVGILIFVSNWAGPIFWSTAGLEVLVEQAIKTSSEPRASSNPATSDNGPSVAPQQSPYTSSGKQTTRLAIINTWIQHIRLLTLFMAVGCVGVMGACLVLRTHLFVWTVFSPKFLYAAAWFVGWHLGVNVLFCGLVLWVSL